LNQPEAHCGVPAFAVAGHVERAASVMPAVPSMFVAEKAAKEKSTDAASRALFMKLFFMFDLSLDGVRSQ
jgi:hypothetical protein